MLNKKEIIWREILYRCFEDGVFVFTQKELAATLNISLSTVHHALKAPRASGAIAVTGRNFRVQDKEKFLLLWASHRRFPKDVRYATTATGGVFAIEGAMPPDAIYAAYSAYRKRYGAVPADYDTVYVYIETEHFAEVKRRFPSIKGTPNLFVLAADSRLSRYGGATPDVQTFVDLWNMPQWYAKDFLDALKKKLRLV